MPYISNNYPTSIQNPTAPIASDDTAVIDVAGFYKFENDSITQLKTKVGANNSTDTTSHDYKLSSLTGSNKALSSDLSGIPNAATAVKGLVKTSVAPASVVNPIAVGDNDPRVPTQGENDALVGTSGTPSSSNKYVTNDDTSTVGSGSKIPRGVSGKIDTSWLPSSATTTFSMPAGENITAGQAVYVGYYQSGASILYDNKQVFSNGWSGTSTAITNSFTVANNTNRVLIVAFGSDFSTGGVGSVSSISYGGVPMTAVQTSSVGIEGGLFYLANPATGANNLTYTVTSGSGGNAGQIAVQVFSVYNAIYTTSNKAITSQTSINEVFQIYGVNLAFAFKGGNPGASTQTSTQLPNNNQSDNNARLGYFSGMSDVIDVYGTSSLVFNPGVYGTYDQIYSIGLTPSNTPTAGYAKLSTASNSFLGGNDRYTKFLGFAINTATVTNNVSINSYFLDTLSGLTLNNVYYISDSKGAISTSAGTNNKKVGIAISTTSLLIKDSI